MNNNVAVGDVEVRIVKRALIVGVTALMSGFASSALAAEFNFSIHHFLSPKAGTHTKMIEPWVKNIEEASGGRIKFEIFPAMALGGKPPELYNQVRDGVADIIWTLPGYTPGVFPRVEVFELPSVHKGNAVATNKAIQDLAADLAEDFKDIHPLLVHVHAGNALHLTSKDVQSLADMKGLKVRSPSRTGAWMLESWGAEPVGMPVPALPQALAKNNIDGGLIPFEIAIPLKIAELTDYSVELNAGQRFGTSTFLFAMNKASYNSLPDDLKKVIDDNSGAAFADAMGKVWDDVEPIGIQLARDKGNKVTALTAEASAEFATKAEMVGARWIKEVSGNGIDGDALMAKAKAAIAAHSDK
ncbi:TRAP transporter substrate-binding protein [Lentilitoribacter sp. EG35]|uniref:TRAP transporter substrate-binding protein n=1 Tax=Lentilitoribacter sp. EG35 TaxID=3234192 RepID=UPI00345FE169